MSLSRAACTTARALVRTDQAAFPADESTDGPLLPAKCIRLTGKTAAPPVEEETREWLKALEPLEIFVNGGYCLKDQKLVQALLNVDTIHMPPAFSWASRTVYVWDNDDSARCVEYQRRWKKRRGTRTSTILAPGLSTCAVRLRAPHRRRRRLPVAAR